MYGKMIEEIIKESNGRLQIGNIIMQAGQKVVWKGTHSEHGEVVLKLGDYNTRIEQEYEIIQSIRNENFPKIYDFQNRRGIFYILEEYISNGSLSDIKNKILYQSEEKIIGLLKDIVIQMTPIWEKNMETKKVIRKEIFRRRKEADPIAVHKNSEQIWQKLF